MPTLTQTLIFAAQCHENQVDPEEEADNAHGYERFIARCALNPPAAKVKLADLEDNSDAKRLGTLTDKDRRRLAKYETATRYLLADEEG